MEEWKSKEQQEEKEWKERFREQFQQWLGTEEGRRDLRIQHCLFREHCSANEQFSEKTPQQRFEVFLVFLQRLAALRTDTSRARDAEEDAAAAGALRGVAERGGKLHSSWPQRQPRLLHTPPAFILGQEEEKQLMGMFNQTEEWVKRRASEAELMAVWEKTEGWVNESQLGQRYKDPDEEQQMASSRELLDDLLWEVRESWTPSSSRELPRGSPAQTTTTSTATGDQASAERGMVEGEGGAVGSSYSPSSVPPLDPPHAAESIKRLELSAEKKKFMAMMQKERELEEMVLQGPTQHKRGEVEEEVVLSQDHSVTKKEATLHQPAQLGEEQEPQQSGSVANERKRRAELMGGNDEEKEDEEKEEDDKEMCFTSPKDGEIWLPRDENTFKEAYFPQTETAVAEMMELCAPENNVAAKLGNIPLMEEMSEDPEGDKREWATLKRMTGLGVQDDHSFLRIFGAMVSMPHFQYIYGIDPHRASYIEGACQTLLTQFNDSSDLDALWWTYNSDYEP